METLTKVLIGKNEYEIRGVAKIGIGVRFQALLNGVVFSQSKYHDKIRKVIFKAISLEKSRNGFCH